MKVELKLTPEGNYADRQHYLENRSAYVEYWMSIPLKLTRWQRIKYSIKSVFSSKK